MADYKDALKELKTFAEAMSRIPGNAPWSQKISHVAPRSLSHVEKQQVDQLQRAWEDRLKFEVEKLDIREKQAESSQCLSLPVIALGIGTAGVTAFFEALLPLIVVGLPVLIVGLLLYYWPSHVQGRRRSYGDRIRSDYGLHRFPWE